MGKIENFIFNIKQKSFVKSLIDNGGEVFAVGGVVRDLILNKPNKDIDLIVRNIQIDTLIKQLQKFGKVDVVGKSFGVIKFIDSDGTDYDIALPRKEKPTGEGGYHGFDVQSDPNLSIEDDLIRRDAKFNAMAININTGKFIDPLGGLDDIENKQVSAANSEAFSDDPLRMLRMINFASRFSFEIEPQTMKMIQDNAGRIKEIPPERILTEFDKIVKKGNPTIGAQLLIETGLFQQIFGKPKKISGLFNNVKTMSEFIFLLSQGTVENPAEFYKNNLKGDIDSYKEIKALDFAFSNKVDNPIAARSIAHNMFLHSPASLQSQIIPDLVKNAAQELLSGKYPKTISELAVNGNDLIQLGLKGKEIGDALKNMLLKIYANKIQNSKEELISLIDSNNNKLNENINNDRIEYGCLMLYLKFPKWNTITSIINKNDIYDKEGYGIEKESHTTILYGFHNEVNADDIFALCEKNIKLKPIEIKITGVSVFENPEFDVVKFDVDSEILIRLNKLVKELPNTNTFPKYHPHITIAYVKSGMGKKYVKNFTKEYKFIGDELVYTWKGHRNRENGRTLKLNNFKQINENVSTWNINGEDVGINFFVRKYDEWNNQGNNIGYSDPSKTSVLEFLQNNFEDFSHDEVLKQELLWSLTDRDVLNESKDNNSSYSENKASLLRSKSISKEMKEKILEYFGAGSTYHEGGRVHGLIKPKGFTEKTPKSRGVSLGADKNGFYCYTHRAASKRYETPEKISIKDIEFIESTG